METSWKLPILSKQEADDLVISKPGKLSHEDMCVHFACYLETLRKRAP